MLDKYISLIQAGEPVAFPTETVYGLGADAWNSSAIKKVFSTKGRPSDNPLIVHISDKKMLSDFTDDVSPAAEKLIDAFWPGPLTLIFRKKPEVLDLITAGMPTVALRWPAHPLSQALIAQTGPLVAPSANSSGRPSPTKPEHVKEDFGADFPVVDGGITAIGLESTVLDVSEEPFRIYRPGHIGKTEIEGVLNTKVMLAPPDSRETAVKSPGTRYTHYAPKAEVCWLDDGFHSDSDSTLYLFHSSESQTSPDAGNILCYSEDYRKMAHELYDRFREADHKGYDRIIIEPFSRPLSNYPPIAEALANRISKAVKK